MKVLYTFVAFADGNYVVYDEQQRYLSSEEVSVTFDQHASVSISAFIRKRSVFSIPPKLLSGHLEIASVFSFPRLLLIFCFRPRHLRQTN